MEQESALQMFTVNGGASLSNTSSPTLAGETNIWLTRDTSIGVVTFQTNYPKGLIQYALPPSPPHTFASILQNKFCVPHSH